MKLLQDKNEKKVETRRAREKTRVYIGTVHIERWRKVKEERGFRTDSEVAAFLLDQ